MIITTGSYERDGVRATYRAPERRGEVDFEPKPRPSMEAATTGYIKIGDLKLGLSRTRVIAGRHIWTHTSQRQLYSATYPYGCACVQRLWYRPDYKLKWDVSLERH